MDKILNLVAGDFTIRLNVADAENWCKVYFLDSKNGSSVFLGVDTLKIICYRLFSALKREDLSNIETHKHGNLELFWILSLSEQHASIYGSLTDSLGIRIFCVEDGGQFLPEILLEEQDIENWIITLKEFVV